MMILISLCIFRRRAFERNSKTERAGVSSMNNGAEPSGLVADSR